MVSLEDKRREWIERLQALRNKKEEELKEIEKKKRKELEEAEEMLRAGVEELTQEEIDILEELSEDVPEVLDIETPKEASEDLEETVRKTQAQASASEDTGPDYTSALEEVSGQRQLSQIASYEGYNELKDVLERAQSGEYLTKSERNNIYEAQQELQSVAGPNLGEADPFGYVERSKQVINAIDKTLSRSLYKSGDDHL